MKKLIVIDGVDSSGKETNANFVHSFLKKEGKNVTKISFPDYQSDSSALVKMYLAGEFGKTANDVNAYAASSFYAVDRFASFKTSWGKDFYESDGYIVADRYVTSNMIHQAAKIADPAEKEAFLNWLYDYEYEKLGLPKPDLVIFLNMPIWAVRQLIKDRANKITGQKEKDIHENDEKYLQESYNNAMSIAKKFGWTIIDCTIEDRIKSFDEIQDEIRNIVNNL